jgi:hypothetical protein
MIVFNEAMFRFIDGGLKKVCLDNTSVDGWLDKLFSWAHTIYNKNQIWNYCYRKTFLLEYDIKCPETHHLEDISMSISAACHAKKLLFFPICFYEYRISGGGDKLSLEALGREGDTEQTKRKTGRKLFFDTLARICEADTPPDRKERVECLLYKCILYSLYQPEAYRDNESVLGALNALREKMAAYTGNWQKNAYISPCFFEAPAAARLLSDEFRIGGGGAIRRVYLPR